MELTREHIEMWLETRLNEDELPINLADGLDNSFTGIAHQFTNGPFALYNIGACYAPENEKLPEADEHGRLFPALMTPHRLGADPDRAAINAWLEKMFPGREFLLCDGMEAAFAGVVSRKGHPPCALYSREKAIQSLVDGSRNPEEPGSGMDREEAEEFFEFNTAGAWVGELTPVFAAFTAEEAAVQWSMAMFQSGTVTVGTSLPGYPHVWVGHPPEASGDETKREHIRCEVAEDIRDFLNGGPIPSWMSKVIRTHNQNPQMAEICFVIATNELAGMRFSVTGPMKDARPEQTCAEIGFSGTWEDDMSAEAVELRRQVAATFMDLCVPEHWRFGFGAGDDSTPTQP
jgi:hypothetical protein